MGPALSGLLPQMTEYCNGIAEVRVEIPLRSEFHLTFLTFKKGAHDYNDHIETLIIIYYYGKLFNEFISFIRFL